MPGAHLADCKHGAHLAVVRHVLLDRLKAFLTAVVTWQAVCMAPTWRLFTAFVRHVDFDRSLLLLTAVATAAGVHGAVPLDVP
jgi:hypothetical protein